ncbi:MAG: MarR family winged helix-turn-helix transcriptional regulator [Candidatus Thorarchaeota archaeon]
MSISEGGFLITKIHHLSGRIFSKKLKDHGIEISPGQGRILFALWQEDSIPIRELTKRTQLGKSTLTDMLDRMDSEGLVERKASDVDKRRTLVHLTEKTKKLHQKYLAVSKEMTEIFYHGFTNEDIEVIEEYLRRLLFNLVQFQEMR